MSVVAVVDYGSGNLRSVWQAARAVASAGTEVLVTAEAERVRAADRVIFPGQGAIGDCLAHLRQAGLGEAVLEAIAGKPTLAICVGMQMLFESSEEDGGTAALGHFAGRVVRFSGRAPDGTRLKVPQMGWNSVRQRAPHPLWEGVPDNAWFYFVHSYHVAPEDLAIVVGVTDYGVEFASAVARDYLFATQFHPEKSGPDGLRLYANFMRWSP